MQGTLRLLLQDPIRKWVFAPSNQLALWYLAVFGRIGVELGIDCDQADSALQSLPTTVTSLSLLIQIIQIHINLPTRQCARPSMRWTSC